MEIGNKVLEYLSETCPRKRSRSLNRSENFINLQRKPNFNSPLHTIPKAFVVRPGTQLPLSAYNFFRFLSPYKNCGKHLKCDLNASAQIKLEVKQQFERNHNVRGNNRVRLKKKSGLEEFLRNRGVLGVSSERIKRLWGKVDKKGENEFFAQIQEVKLIYKDVKKLRAGQWINDEIINAYIGLVQKKEDVHVFQTYFFQYLESMNQTSWDLEKLIRIIMKTGLESLTEKNYLVIPANINKNHWVVVALNHKRKTIEYYDSLGTRNMEKVCEVFERFLRVMGQEVYDWEGMDVRRQQNGFDCGVFVLKVVQALAGNAEFRFVADEMKYIRKVMLAELKDGKIYVE